LTRNLKPSKDKNSASIVPSFRDDRSVVATQLVPVFTGEHLRKTVNLSDLALIKIDVEGAEADVFEALVPIIVEHQPLIAFELLPAYSESNTRRVAMQNKVLDLLKKQDYRIFRTIKANHSRLKGFMPVETFGIHSDLALTDYVALPERGLDGAIASLGNLILPSAASE
jgi:hypothetical protein